MITSKLLFAVHTASESHGGEIGHLSGGVWALAMSDTAEASSYEDLPGFWALHEAVIDPEEFSMCAFGGGDLSGPPNDASWGGLWVYEVKYEDPGETTDDQVLEDPEFWSHLWGGAFRRPTPAELSQVCGNSAGPWQVVL
jgi:hypothetical protein